MTETQILEARVGNLVTEDLRRARVFKNYGIDFCCGGGITVKEACRRKGVPEGELISAINDLDQSPAGATPTVDGWTATFLMDYIVNVHHGFVRKQIPAIRAFSEKVAKVHGHAQPELDVVRDRFAVMATEMEAHMAFEENELFPAIREAQSDRDAGLQAEQMLGTAEDEHDAVAAIMAELRRVTNDFTPPDWACTTYKALYAHLAEFEQDLHIHVHLENNVLFQKART
ncbi:MAG: iron-sulfur cluster repair di-iron protein [Rhodothermales bacterium]|nr:iron-sulfur cluster repair di-iron protein [Rhodothermales bacterium]